ncbi:iron-siderophore ABC transporter substrate-binding protein [Ancylobacter sp. Lp-2]|uniref:iron-siderophore ABC transporter substrate-binding protein n=1 Tax=Ancylobacter sp. Lp-2 TaxID=2881339 RepID=UPI001E4C8000|nr:iron-siderophore ABC transporter substrate-binding protein [Ancylobacter sp. Lp-2]
MTVPALVSRRAVLRGGFCLGALAHPLLPGAGRAETPARPPHRIVSLDFGLAETLIEMGLPPIALPNPGTWADWVVEPALPAGIVNLGTDREPNLELLASLRPDLIITTPYLAGIRRLLEGVAPTREFSIYAPPVGHPYDRSVTATRELAAILGREREGEALIARAETTMAATRELLVARGVAAQPIMVVSFLDTRHVRVYTAGGLFGDVMERCGLTNGWTRPGNYWGFSTVGIEALAESPASRLVYLEPISADTLDTLAASPLWNSLPFARAGQVYRLPAVLMFGMLPSAMRFADQMARLFTGEAANG